MKAVNMRLDEQLWAAVRAKAEAQGLTVTAYVKQLFEAALLRPVNIAAPVNTPIRARHQALKAVADAGQPLPPHLDVEAAHRGPAAGVELCRICKRPQTVHPTSFCRIFRPPLKSA